MNNIYLDASATTPPHIDGINKLKDIQSECWGNPSSIHKVGVVAREILERSRLSIANKLKASSDEIFFTSGATESNYLSLKVVSNNLDKGRIVISSVEHPSINLIANQLLNDGWIPPLDQVQLTKGLNLVPEKLHETLVPSKDVWERCWSLPPLDFFERNQLQERWNESTP